MNYSFTDLHTHILPGMDDGSPDVQTSIEMLEKIKSSGIKSIILTSHFYPHNENPESFLERRDAAVKRLLEGISPDMEEKLPEMYIGAEVAFYSGMSRSTQIRALNIKGSNYILIEMPFRKWTKSEIMDLIDIRSHLGLIPIVAHLERYEKYQKKDTMCFLSDSGVLFQMNSEYIIDKKTRKKAFDLICKGYVQFIASDCHNLTSRPPTLSDCIEILNETFSPEFLGDVERYEKMIIKKAERLFPE